MSPITSHPVNAKAETSANSIKEKYFFMFLSL
jgi:hypothetical protein